jgi:pyridoxal phosphate enzyme (YggS family)
VNQAQWQEATEPTKARLAELAQNLVMVKDQIASAATLANRSPDEVTLVVVTKTFPPEDILALAQLGIRDIGESRDQEAKSKFEILSTRLPTDMRWHFIGQLQTNKARSVANYADFVHSVDRASLVTALAKGARNAGREVTALAQVDLSVDSGDANRGGISAGAAIELAQQIEESDGLRLGGVMGVAPLGDSPGAAFARLAVVAEQVRATYPQALVISAGMSDDMNEAIAAGATHVRVGSKVLGFRPPIG